MFAFGFSLCAILSSMGLMMRSGMGFMKNLGGAILALVGSIILVTGLFSEQIYGFAALGLIIIGLLIALVTLLPKLMKSMQNVILYIYHIGYLIMTFIICLTVLIIEYW